MTKYGAMEGHEQTNVPYLLLSKVQKTFNIGRIAFSVNGAEITGIHRQKK